MVTPYITSRFCEVDLGLKSKIGAMTGAMLCDYDTKKFSLSDGWSLSLGIPGFRL